MSLNFNSESTIFCMCEGVAETFVINKLLDNDRLIFTRDELHDNEPIQRMKSKEFQSRFLNYRFESKPILIRILDSKREKFHLGHYYENKIDVVNVITHPEIEMLIVHAEGYYDDYCKKQKKYKKPSSYCKEVMGYKNVKKEEFLNEYFNDVDKLTNAIKQYNQKTQKDKDFFNLFDLLK